MMSSGRDTVIDELITQLPSLLFTGDPVVNYLAPSALEELARLRTLLRQGQYAAASHLVERELAPTLHKLEDMLGELVERNVSPFKELTVVGRVMDLSGEFLEVHLTEFQRSLSQK